MTAPIRPRPHLAGNPADAPRPTATVRSVAEILAADESVVRRLVDSGTLEAHTIGKRGVRIFLDSVAEYQRNQARAPVSGPRKIKPKPAPNAASTAAYRAAQAYLEERVRAARADRRARRKP